MSIRKILVVDDEPTLSRAISRMLAAHDVTTVGNGREALAKLEAGERYDVILTDVMMPVLDGIELYGALTTVAPEQVNKMVFMTGGGFSKQAAEFFERVANPTIEKPFDRIKLFAVLDRLLR